MNIVKYELAFLLT